MKKYIYIIVSLLLTLSACDDCPQEGDFAPAGMELSVTDYMGYDGTIHLNYEDSSKVLYVDQGTESIDVHKRLGELAVKSSEAWCKAELGPWNLMSQDLNITASDPYIDYEWKTRSAEVEVYYKNYPQYSLKIRVEQQAYEGFVIFNLKQIELLPRNGGSVLILYGACVDYYIKSISEDFIRPGNGAFNGNGKNRGEWKIYFTENTTGKERCATIRFVQYGNPNIYKDIRIVQSA